jgi:mannitol/fructose-specific phosphotransferase system IIA component (Ntr-type)
MKPPLLLEENVIAGLEASDHAEALRQIINALPEGHLSVLAKRKILELLIMREQMGTTALGQGIALPHCFSPLVQQPIVAFAVSPQGISYGSLDGQPVHFVFLLILPSGEASERLKRQILQNIKWVLCDRYMQERLKAAITGTEIYQLIMPAAQPFAKVGV